MWQCPFDFYPEALPHPIIAHTIACCHDPPTGEVLAKFMPTNLCNDLIIFKTTHIPFQKKKRQHTYAFQMVIVLTNANNN
jgi:hypothetical protein